MDKKGEVWKLFLVLLPSVGATLIAVSRIMDARHHPFDVITGALLGTLCATIAYRQYFPSLFEPWKKGRAHPIREWGAEPTDPTISASCSIDRTGDAVQDGIAESSTSAYHSRHFQLPTRPENGGAADTYELQQRHHLHGPSPV